MLTAKDIGHLITGKDINGNPLSETDKEALMGSFILDATMVGVSSLSKLKLKYANKVNKVDGIEEVINPKVIYGELDSLGRPTGINATITSDMIGIGSSASSSIKPPGFLGGGEGHARGHLFGSQLGGSGKDPRNLVTLYQNPVNTPVMSSFERQVRKAVEAGETINYSVAPIYKGNQLIPSGVTLNANGSEGFQLDVTILNRK